eukprot:10051276-Karenia_brevis.AAC.1
MERNKQNREEHMEMIRRLEKVKDRLSPQKEHVRFEEPSTHETFDLDEFLEDPNQMHDYFYDPGAEMRAMFSNKMNASEGDHFDADARASTGNEKVESKPIFENPSGDIDESNMDAAP